MSVSTRYSHSSLLPTGVGEFLHLLWARELPLSDRCHLVTVFHVEASGSPRFLGNPSCSHAPLSDPGGPAQSHRLDWTDTAFRIPDDVGPAFNRAFEALSRGLTARCLRFATRVTPDHARLATDPLVRLWPGGTCTHWVTYSLDFQRGIGAPPLLSSQAYPGAPRGRDRKPELPTKSCYPTQTTRRPPLGDGLIVPSAAAGIPWHRCDRPVHLRPAAQ
jgi:hypothetical protein